MLVKWICMSLLMLVAQDVMGSHYIDVSKYDMVYYDPNTRLGLKGELEDHGRDPLPGIAFHGVGCNCENFTCGCCTGINITAFNFDRHACTNFTYIPEDFAIKLKFIMNEKVLLSTGPISAKNPPPLCMPFYLPFVSFCVRFFDVYTSGKNLHACIDFETLVVRWPILILHFDCVKIGADGVSWMKPEEVSGEFQAVKPEVAESSGPEVYDEVNFESDSTELPSSQTLSLTPEEEDNIGQLKL
ncbi:unnamed protein product [Lasius platythorax]|uniref:DUF4773 domain-containing protein n=1 Tax=Lasius platythorax TaxID=488582 RepID=A0AAV2PBQ4_9HYME